MTDIKNRVIVINVVLILTLCVITTTSAQTPIATQALRLDALNDLSYQIKLTKSKVELSKSTAELTKSKVELAKLKKQCLESSGCLAGNNNHLASIANNTDLLEASNNNNLLETDNSHLSETGNNSHLSAIGNNAASTISGRKNTQAVVKKTLKPIQTNQTNLIKKLNQLSIRAIINQQVAFQGIEGSFRQGDMLEQGDELDSGGIKIITITDSSVVLGTANNIIKTLTMDWIDD